MATSRPERPDAGLVLHLELVRLTRGMARHLVRVDRSDIVDEVEAIALSASLSVRELRRRLGGHESDGCEGERRRFVQLTRHVERLDAVAFEGVIRLMEALGETTRSAAIEGLLAEGLTTLLNRAELAQDLVSRIAGSAPGGVAPHESAAQEVTTAEPDTDIGPASEQSLEQPLMAPPCIDPAITDVGLLDLELRALSAELMRRDLRLGELALEAECLGVAHMHGHRTLDDYCREALGIAPSSMAARVALARRARRLPLLKVAIEAGAVGFETATLLARVATPSTEEAWLELADISTTKMFREHVDAAELHARANGSPLDALVPPTREQIDETRELERKVLSMVFADPGDSNGIAHTTDAVRDPEPGPMSVSALSEEAELGTVPLRMTSPCVSAPHGDENAWRPIGSLARLRPAPPRACDRASRRFLLTLPDDLAAFWCDLEILHADAVFPMGSFVGFLVGSTLDTWRGTTRLPAYGDIYLRDRFRCQNPICRSRNCTPHHLVFRSHGGGDEPSNLVSLCDRCHLSLVHGGHLTVTGLAPHALHWSARAYRADSTNSMVA